MGLAVYPRASFAWEWKAFSEGGFAEGGLRGWLAFSRLRRFDVVRRMISDNA